MVDPVAPLLTEAERHALKGVVVDFPRGSVLFREGELTKETFVLLKGHVKVTYGAADRIIAIRGPGETVGELAALHDQPRSASVIAIEDISVQIISQEDWLDFLFDPANRRVVKALFRQQSARIREASTKQLQAGLFSVERRLAQRLLELANKIGQSDGDTVIIRDITQSELAGFVGAASRDSVAQLMRAFRRRGLVSTGRMKIVVYNVALLRKVAEGASTTL